MDYYFGAKKEILVLIKLMLNLIVSARQRSAFPRKAQ